MQAITSGPSGFILDASYATIPPPEATVASPRLRDLALQPAPTRPAGSPRCLPCRRRKKKCDGLRPSCSPCLRSRAQDVCAMVPGKTRGRKPSKSQQGGADHESVSTTLSSDVALASLRLPKLSPIVHSPGGLSDIPESITQISGQKSITMLQTVVDFFQHRIVAGNSGYKQSLMSFAFSHVMSNPTVFHAYLANLSTMCPGLPPYWQARCLVHYDHAVKGLILGLQRNEPSDASTIRGTSILLHMFEASQSAQSRDDAQTADLSSAHLRAANRIFMSTMNEPMTLADAQFCEGYIQRVAHNHLFHPDALLPYEYLAQLLAAWQAALSQARLSPSREVSSRLYLLGPELFNMVYKLSWLNSQRPLRGNHLIEGVKLIRALSGLGIDDGLHADTDTDEGKSTILVLATRAACLCLADDIVNEEYQRDGRNMMPFLLGTRLLDLATLQLSGDALASFVWPLTVIGSLASDAQAQAEFTEMAARLRSKMGKGSVNRMEFFWNTVWLDAPRSPFTNRQALSGILI